MPTFKDVNVCVRTDNGRLPEYAVHHYPKSNSTYCYIESRTNVSFKITVAPTLPFPHYDTPHTSTARMHTKLQAQSPPPFHLLASVYLDGRNSPDRRTIAYLDPDHPEFRAPHGHAHLRAKFVKTDGELKECPWVFSELGIDTMLGHLRLSQGSEDFITPEVAAEDEMLAALTQTSLDPESNVRSEKDKGLGMIVVELKRVLVGAIVIDSDYNPKHASNDDNGLDVGGFDVSHTISLGAGKPVPRDMATILYNPYRNNEEVFARFVFFYRSAETLRKLKIRGFPSHDAEITASVTKREKLAQKLAYIDPLGITTGKGRKRTRSATTSNSEELNLVAKLARSYSSHDIDVGDSSTT